MFPPILVPMSLISPRVQRLCSVALMVLLYVEYVCFGDALLSGTATTGVFALLALSTV